MERCAGCGREPEPGEPLWTWSQERLEDGQRERLSERGAERGSKGVGPLAEVLFLCPACAREHARSIEAKLDAEWW